MDLFNNYDRIGGVIVSVLASIVVDRRFEPRSGQPNDYQIGICCFSAKHAACRSKCKDWIMCQSEVTCRPVLLAH